MAPTNLRTSTGTRENRSIYSLKSRISASSCSFEMFQPRTWLIRRRFLTLDQEGLMGWILSQEGDGRGIAAVDWRIGVEEEA
jgi:hypothetical protein